MVTWNLNFSIEATGAELSGRRNLTPLGVRAENAVESEYHLNF